MIEITLGIITALVIVFVLYAIVGLIVPWFGYLWLKYLDWVDEKIKRGKRR